MAIQRVHIFVVDPSVIIRSVMIAILRSFGTLSIDVAGVSDLTTFVAQGFKQLPDLLLINPSHLGQFSLTQIKGELENDRLKIVALQSAFVDQSLLQNYDEVISIYDSVETIQEKIERVAQQREVVEGQKELSQREKEIIVCVVKGLTNKQIAEELFLSTHTVIAHRRNIASKLQIHSPSGLTIYAIVNKLVDLSEVKNSISQSRDL